MRSLETKKTKFKTKRSLAVNFQALSEAVVEQAIQGDSSVVFVESSE